MQLLGNLHKLDLGVISIECVLHRMRSLEDVFFYYLLGNLHKLDRGVFATECALPAAALQ